MFSPIAAAIRAGHMAIDARIGNAPLYKYFIYAKGPSGAASRTRGPQGAQESLSGRVRYQRGLQLYHYVLLQES